MSYTKDTRCLNVNTTQLITSIKLLHISAYFIQNINDTKFYLEWLMTKCFYYHNTVFLCISTLCILQFNILIFLISVMQFLDRRVIFIFLPPKIPWGWHPRAETCRRLILVMNCIFKCVFFVDISNVYGKFSLRIYFRILCKHH